MAPPISLSAGGGTSGSTSNAGVSSNVSTPFNFDNSGWVVNFGNNNGTSAGGNTDANGTRQSPGAGSAAGILGGVSPSTLLILVAAYFLLTK
jgi:hypothetical protein